MFKHNHKKFTYCRSSQPTTKLKCSSFSTKLTNGKTVNEPYICGDRVKSKRKLIDSICKKYYKTSYFESSHGHLMRFSQANLIYTFHNSWKYSLDGVLQKEVSEMKIKTNRQRKRFQETNSEQDYFNLNSFCHSVFLGNNSLPVKFHETCFISRSECNALPS